MESKRFLGAPFGKQSSRFDVSVVHPSTNKTGSFSEFSHYKKLINKQKPAVGPGSYGKGGIPSALLDEKRRMPVGTCPTIDFSAGVERFPERLVDSGLYPGTYNFKSFTELILNRHVSKRGPYDLFSARRENPIICGYFSSPKNAHMNPGTFYEPAKSICDDLQRPENKLKGKFKITDQYPEQAREKHSGPGLYEPFRLPKVENRNPPPFLSSTPRITKRVERLMQGNYTTVGVGCYNLAKRQPPRSQRSSNFGYRYIFKSRTPRYLQNLDQDNYNQEKLQPRNIPPHCRVYFRPPDQTVKTTVSDSLEVRRL
ncbi:lymphocyte expansion molecule-like [Hypomesus transpacificus]|uniref:lymphocyte expansion molecule-like n=1 Tax=Hypomesus transpacificus TaxID=137520 RepID=UPI001F079D83|nr:lymphocyte expansion molecule-like [Hypomesus transpacificus]